MKRSRIIQAAWLALPVMLILGLFVTPASAASTRATRANRQQTNASPVNATIYLTTSSLSSLFQGQLNTLVPAAFNSTINSTLSQLPAQDRGWASQMIATLIQPSATLTSLSPQQNGLATSIRIALYPGDPQPISAAMLVSFQALNSSTVQVNAQALNGGPALANGPVATIPVSFGQLKSIATTPNCGSSALGLHLQIPLSLGQSKSNVINAPNAQSTTQPLNDYVARTQSTQLLQSLNPATSQLNAVTPNSFIELPAASLASIGTSIGTMPVSGSLTAQNIQIGVQGKDITITSDIVDSFWGQIGTAVTTLAPTVSHGSLAVNVLSTQVTILGIFTFPYNTYNQQIQQTLNAKLNGAFSGKFTVTQAQIGPTTALPCAASTSLVLAGSTNIG
jgi:hypothetical protein